LFAPVNEVISMQRFVAELSTVIEQAAFEQSWRNDPTLDDRQQTKVDFASDGRRVSALIDSDRLERWPSASFYRTFSAAVRRVDRSCNIRWL
jgi:hypothetical protein